MYQQEDLMQNISNYPVVRSGEAPRKRCAQILKLHTATEPSEARGKDNDEKRIGVDKKNQLTLLARFTCSYMPQK